MKDMAMSAVLIAGAIIIVAFISSKVNLLNIGAGA